MNIIKIKYLTFSKEYTNIEILSGDKSDTVSVKYLGHLVGNDLLHTGWWYNAGVPKVLSPMPWEASQDWLDSEWDEVFDWFFKEISKNEVDNSGLADFIQKWAK